jgi:uncharacterized membrane protein YgcG
MLGPEPSMMTGTAGSHPEIRALVLTLALACAGAAPLGLCQSPSRPAAQSQPDPDRHTTHFLARRPAPGSIPAATLARARAAHAAMVRIQSASSDAQPAPPSWQPIGPFQVATSAWNLVSGEVLSLATDPSDPSGNTVFTGTEGGGVWKSTNAAGPAADVTFTPLTDTLGVWSSSALTSLSIGALSVQPGGTGVILAGTGDPNNATSSWYGAGILRSTDGGNTWSLIHETPSSLYSGFSYNFYGNAFAGFAWSTTTSGLVVAAVTDAASPLVTGTTSLENLLGLYYSQDAGATWYLATIEDGSTVIQGDQYINDGGNAATAVVWNPIRQRFYAAIRYHGYYESLDGITWTRLANQPGVNLTTTMCPTNPRAPASRACPIYRGALAVQPVTGDMFALTVDQNNIDQGLWQDICNLTSNACASSTVQFGTRISDQPLEALNSNGVIAQAAYDLWLAAVPSQQDTLLFAGTQDIWKCSLANSCVWRNATSTQTCDSAQVAPNQHAIDATFGSAGLLYFGNDGGLWRTTDNLNLALTACSSSDANHFQNLNAGLGSLAQVENFSEDPNDSSTWLAAVGDLGTAAPNAGSATLWNQVLNGDGNNVAVDPANPENWYATSVFGVGINRCTEGASCNIAGFGNVAIGESQVENDYQTIPAPWILDPQNTSSIIVGTCRVWRGPASGSGWSQLNLLSSMLDEGQGSFCDGNAEILSLAAGVNTTASAPGSEQLYAGMAGALDGGGLVPGHLFTAAVNNASEASNTQWLDRYGSPVTNNGSQEPQFNPNSFGISSVYPDPHDPTGQSIYVTIQGINGINGGQALVYLSTDAGAHWTDITSNLPVAPANGVMVDPNNPGIVYVALDTGVYVTQNVANCGLVNGACWNVYGAGLPNAPVLSLNNYNEGTTEVLRAATWGRGIWQVNLATAGFAPTTVSATPASISFPNQQVGSVSSSRTVTIRVTGRLNFTITTVSATGDFAETDTCAGESLAPNGTCQLQVTFAPTQTGSRTGSIFIDGNVSGGQLAIPLSGTGLAPASIALTPASLTFGNTLVGQPSAPQSITIANIGGEPSPLTSETVTGDFSISANTCASSLAPNSSCTVSILFTPTASGTRSGQLTVVDAVGTQIASLSGSGQTVATDVLSPSTLAFGSQQLGTVSAAQQVTLTNNGDQPLTSIAVSVTGGDFNAVNNCGTVLQGHGSCSIAVTYSPSVAKSETATLVVADEFRTQNVALSGTGLTPPGVSASPTSINFGDLAVGSTSSPQTVTVTNSGGYALASLTVTVTSGFAIASNNCAVTLAVASNCQIAVAFSPAAAGNLTGTLTVAASNLPQPLAIALSGSGDDFSLAVSGASSAIITSGQTAAFTLQLEGLGGTSGIVSLSCTGAPQNSTCTLNPSKVELTSLNTSTVTASLATGVSTSSSAAPPGPAWRTLVPVFALVLPLGCAGFRRGRRALPLLLLATLVFALSACGTKSSAGSGGTGGSGGGTGGGGGGTGGGGGGVTTPSGTYTLTITAGLSNIQHSVQCTVTVQ